MIRVQLCTAQPLVTAGLRNILSEHSDIEINDRSGDFTTVARGNGSVATDVILIRPSMQEMAVLQAASVGEAQPKSRPGIVMIGSLSEHTILAAVGCGVRGLVSDEAVDEDLILAVRALAAGQGFLSPRLTHGLFAWLAGQLPNDPGRFSMAHDVLTEREREVLRALGQGCTDAQIAKALSISRTTVRSHVYHILTKLGLPNRMQAVLFGYQYQLVGGPSHARPGVRRHGGRLAGR